MTRKREKKKESKLEEVPECLQGVDWITPERAPSGRIESYHVGNLLFPKKWVELMQKVAIATGQTWEDQITEALSTDDLKFKLESEGAEDELEVDEGESEGEEEET
jgi:hypothetical protein